MRIGLSIPSSQPWGDRAAVTAVAQEADRSGFDSVWTADHLLAPLGDLDEVGFERSRYQWMTGRPADTQRVTPQQYYGSNNWFLEGYSVMAYLAGVTERVRIGSSVVVLPYRNPIVQARAVQTIDVLSGGRISLGVGAGHVRAESEALGVPYNERAAMTEEYIRVMRAIWAGRHRLLPRALLRLRRGADPGPDRAAAAPDLLRRHGQGGHPARRPALRRLARLARPHGARAVQGGRRLRPRGGPAHRPLRPVRGHLHPHRTLGGARRTHPGAVVGGAHGRLLRLPPQLLRRRACRPPAPL